MNIESKRLRREPNEVIAQHSRSRSYSDCLARQEGPFTMQKHQGRPHTHDHLDRTLIFFAEWRQHDYAGFVLVCLIDPREKPMFRRFTGTLALLLAAMLNTQNRAPTGPQEFHGTYEELSPVQRKLIDDWYAEYNQMTHDNS